VGGFGYDRGWSETRHVRGCIHLCFAPSIRERSLSCSWVTCSGVTFLSMLVGGLIYVIFGGGLIQVLSICLAFVSGLFHVHVHGCHVRG